MEMGVCSGHGPEFGPKPKGVLGALGKFFMLRISGQLPRSRFLDALLDRGRIQELQRAKGKLIKC